MTFEVYKADVLHFYRHESRQHNSITVGIVKNDDTEKWRVYVATSYSTLGLGQLDDDIATCTAELIAKHAAECRRRNAAEEHDDLNLPADGIVTQAT